MRPISLRRHAIQLALGWALAGCAGSVRGPDVTPSDLPRLEAERSRKPNDRDVLLRLGAGYYRAGRMADALGALRAAAATGPTFAVYAYQGLTFEGLNQLDSAFAAYRRAAPLASSRSERAQLEYRLANLTRQRLAVSAKAAVSRESELSRTAPAPNSVAVLPWSYLGQNPELRPLERGITQLVVTDLSRIGSLVLLEREQVQALTDELKLSASARTEPGTGARSGRLLRAARVVNGTLRETAGSGNLRLDANAVQTTTGRVAATGSASNSLANLIAMEKQMVLSLVDRLGIKLSPTEQRAISERPTADLQAFLAFSRGLEAEDRGDYAAAAIQFRAAAERDPNFRLARDRAQRATDIADAPTSEPGGLAVVAARGLSPDAIPSGGRSAALETAIRIVAPSSGSRLALRSLAPLPLYRPRLPEALRQDDPTRLGVVGQIIIVIPRP